MGIISAIGAIVLRATNAGFESTNTKIQALKKRDRFRHATWFHCGNSTYTRDSRPSQFAESPFRMGLNLQRDAITP